MYISDSYVDCLSGRRFWLKSVSQDVLKTGTRPRYQCHAASRRVSKLSLLSDFRQTAIVRGGVLHRLGLNIVSGRMMRRNYGIDKAVPFDFGVHPTSQMIVGPDGVLRCGEVMHWYVKKVFFCQKGNF